MKFSKSFLPVILFAILSIAIAATSTETEQLLAENSTIPSPDPLPISVPAILSPEFAPDQLVNISEKQEGHTVLSSDEQREEQIATAVVNFTETGGDNDDYETVIIQLKDRKLVPASRLSPSAARGVKRVPARAIDSLSAQKIMITASQDDFLGSLPEESYKINHRFAATNAVTLTVKKSELDTLRRNSAVTSVTEDKPIYLALQDTFPLINGTGARGFVKDGIKVDGLGTTVCVIDTGVNDTHPALVGRVVAKQCFCYDNQDNYSIGCCTNGLPEEADDATDENGHGTHVTGIVAGGNGALDGIAANASIVSIKVLNGSGQGLLSGATAAIDWCIANAGTYGIDAITMSFGAQDFTNAETCESDYPPMTSAIDLATGGGIFVVAASGNRGSESSISSPACIRNVTSVGSSNKADTSISSFTNKGALLDILAPGESVRSSTPGGYALMSGTSQATPHVAGAALLLQQWSRLNGGPDLSPLDVRYLLTTFTTKVIGGYPRLDIAAALNAMYFIDTASGRVQAPKGVIIFDSVVDFNHTHSCVNLSDNFIFVNSSDKKCVRYNTAASVTLTNVPYATAPIILEGDRLCSFPECNVTGFSSGNLSFRVNHFSAYTTGANANLTIYDSNDTRGGAARIYANVTLANFTANYANRTSGNAIAGSCAITVGTAPPLHAEMVFDSSSLVHDYTLNISQTGTIPWNVTCNGSGAEPLYASDTIDVIAFTRPIVAVVKTDARDPANRSSTLNYSINVSNAGDADAFNVTVVETYDGNMTFLGADPAPNTSNMTWIIPFLSPGASLMINVSVQITGIPQNATNISNTIDAANYTDDLGIVYLDTENDTEKTLVVFSNNAPTFNGSWPVQNVTVDEDSVDRTLNLSLHFFDKDNDALVFDLYSSSNPTVAITVDKSNGNVTVIAANNFTSTMTAVFNASDAHATALSNIVTITVMPINDPPTFNASRIIPNLTAVEDSSNDSINLSQHFYDVDGDLLNFSAAHDENVAVTIDQERGILNVTPDADFNGEALLRITADDASGSTAQSNELKIIVSSVNDAPLLQAVPDQSIAEESSGRINLSNYSTDVDGDALSFFVTGQDATKVVCGIANANLTFTTAADFNGTADCMVVASDGSLNSTAVTAIINVANINDAPVAAISSPTSGSTIENRTQINFAGSGIDVEEGTLPASNLGWISSIDGFLGIGAVFNLTTLSVGNHTITLQANDSDGASATGSVEIEITATPSLANLAPSVRITAPADGSNFSDGAQVNFTGIANDSEDGELAGTAVTWRSSIDGDIGTGNSMNASDLSVGVHTLLMIATDSGGKNASDSISITIQSTSGANNSGSGSTPSGSSGAGGGGGGGGGEGQKSKSGQIVADTRNPSGIDNSLASFSFPDTQQVEEHSMLGSTPEESPEESASSAPISKDSEMEMGTARRSGFILLFTAILAVAGGGGAFFFTRRGKDMWEKAATKLRRMRASRVARRRIKELIKRR